MAASPLEAKNKGFSEMIDQQPTTAKRVKTSSAPRFEGIVFQQIFFSNDLHSVRALSCFAASWSLGPPSCFAASGKRMKEVPT